MSPIVAPRRRIVGAIGAVLLRAGGASPLALALGAPLDASAQPGARPARLGFLISETLQGQASRIEALRAGLADLGYVDGANVVIDVRTADGRYERLRELAADLVRRKVDVLVAFGTKAVTAATRATKTIPIVVPIIGDPIVVGVTGSLAHPGANVTGSATLVIPLAGKRVEIGRGGPDRLRRRRRCDLPARGVLHRSPAEGRAAGRSPDRAGIALRARREPEDREGDRAVPAAVDASQRRRGDRVSAQDQRRARRPKRARTRGSRKASAQSAVTKATAPRITASRV